MLLTAASMIGALDFQLWTALIQVMRPANNIKASNTFKVMTL